MAVIPLALLQKKALLPNDAPQFNIIDTYRAKSSASRFTTLYFARGD
jgi:hypothetical protein